MSIEFVSENLPSFLFYNWLIYHFFPDVYIVIRIWSIAKEIYEYPLSNAEWRNNDKNATYGIIRIQLKKIMCLFVVESFVFQALCEQIGEFIDEQ